jgi:hypothetical protein
MYRFDRDILDYAYTDERTGQQPKYADLLTYPKLQDETWKLPDGTMYQKYDYATYFSATKMWGHYGHGFGVFFIPVSTEYYAGGPLRQELMVHQDALILNYIGGGHYGGGGRTTGESGVKMFGPWLLYFNTGDSPQAMIDDAHQRASSEAKKWPYQWVDEPLYPLQRTNVAGQSWPSRAEMFTCRAETISIMRMRTMAAVSFCRTFGRGNMRCTHTRRRGRSRMNWKRMGLSLAATRSIWAKWIGIRRTMKISFGRSGNRIGCRVNLNSAISRGI